MSRNGQTARGKRPDVTIKDIAAKLGLSHTTVSRALNDVNVTSENTKRLVRKTAASMGYIKNSGAVTMRGQNSKIVGLVAPDMQNDFYGTATKTIGEKYAGLGLQLLLAVSHDDPQTEMRAVLALREARVTGIIITPTASPLPRTIALLKAVPTVQFIRRVPAIRTPFVGTDHVAGTALSTEHLARLGHARIAYVGGDRHLAIDRDRLQGYRDALAAAKLHVFEDLIALGPSRASFGFEAGHRLLAMDDPPTAVVAGSVELTLGLLEAVQALRLSVPRDISLVGYGDPEWFAAWQAGVTTVSPLAVAIADEAASMVLDLAKGKPLPAERTAMLLSPQLVVRGTTRGIRGQFAAAS